MIRIMCLFRIFLLAQLVFSGRTIFCQQVNNPNWICWTEETKLKWSDFRYLNDSQTGTTKVKAVCASKIGDFFRLGNDGLPSFRISNFFERNLSWTIDTTKMLLLSHEQLHFDVSELFARKIRKGIEELRLKKITERNKYEALISSTLQELDRFQDEYDKKTFHGAIDVIQHEWEVKIKKELDQLKEYASTLRDCK